MARRILTDEDVDAIVDRLLVRLRAEGRLRPWDADGETASSDPTRTGTDTESSSDRERVRRGVSHLLRGKPR